MNWEKLGFVWEPSGNLAWAKKFATCPTPYLHPSGVIRVYIQCRDANNIGRIGYVDVDPEDPLKVVNISDTPVLDVGKKGFFDDNGVLPTSIVEAPDGRIFMYYNGFELCHNIRYRLLTGLAISDNKGESFERVKLSPILERSDAESAFRAGPHVLKNGSGYQMWYAAGSEWELIDGKEMPVYDIRYAESEDGITWPEMGDVILPIDNEVEHGFGRPYVVIKNGYKQLFYSVRKKNPRAYRMGYAECHDGLNWTRDDSNMGIDISSSGWDSESVEYAAIISVKDKTYCFYNGNEFGRTGFGVAELKKTL